MNLHTIFNLIPFFHWHKTPGIIGSVLGLVGPVSIYCDWVRRKV